MLSENQVVKCRAALEKMYTGQCTVTERQAYIKDNKSTGFQEVETLTDQPCRLSFDKAPQTAPGEAAASLTQVIKLFLSPDVTVTPGSKITVTQNGATGNYTYSGKPAVYSTHQEITLELFKRWA